MSDNTSHKDEEIDLGQLFGLIGKGVSNFFGFFKSLIIGFFNQCINVFLFFRKHFMKFVIAGSIGLLIGLIVDYSKRSVYSATMEVRPNMQSGRSLYKNINYYNELAEQNDSVMLSQIFNISESQAAELISFSIDPIVNENQILSTYDEFLASIDSATAANFEFEEYKANFFQYDYKRHIITVESFQNDVFSLLGGPIINEISNNEFYKDQQDAEFSIIEQDSMFLERSLSEIDTLRKVYLDVMRLEAEKESPQGTNINMGETQETTKEVDLFAKEEVVNRAFGKLKRDRVRYKEIVSVISKFEAIGAEKVTVTKRNSVRISALAIILTLLALIGIEINKYLGRIEKYKENTL